MNNMRNTDITGFMNPLKMLGDAVRGAVAIKSDFNKHIWIGKRTLNGGNLPIGLTLAPGLDLFHYCVMIRGVVYQVAGVDKNGKAIVEIGTVDTSSFTWYVITNDANIFKSESSIKNYAQTFANKDYNVVAGIPGATYGALFGTMVESYKVHCQTFCRSMIMFACDKSYSIVDAWLKVAVGTFLF
jgi:hypothetical protein